MVAGLGTQLACWECGGRPGAGWRGPETLRGPVGCEAGGPPLRSLGCRGLWTGHRREQGLSRRPNVPGG